MNFVIDIILLAIIVLSIFLGWKKGFVRTVLNSLSFFIAIILTGLLYGYVYDWLYPKFFLPKITDIINDMVVKVTDGATLDSLFNKLPQSFTDLIGKFTTVPQAKDYYSANPNASVSSFSEFLASPVASTIGKVLCFILVFIAIMLLLKLVGFLLDSVCKLPLIKSANKLLGILAGIILGFLFAWLLSEAISVLLPKLTLLFPNVFGEDILEKSFVLKYLALFNPFSFITKIV